MESLPKNEMLNYAPNALEEIRRFYDLDKPGRMTEAIELILSWARTQKHFIRTDFHKNFIEMMIITNKGSLERTKQRLERLCTYKSLMPQYLLFGPIDIIEDFKDVFEVATLTFLPEMTDDYYRILMFKGKGENFTSKMFTQYFRYSHLLSEYTLAYDYAAGYIFIIDMREMNLMSFLTQINIMELRQSSLISFEGYGMRLKAIHIISESKMIDGFVKLLQRVLSSKLSSRIFVHKSEEALYKEIPKDCLPQEYGGKGKPLTKCTEEQNEFLGSEEFKRFVAERDEFGVNEAAREKHFITIEYMGLPGTFRSLVVD